MLQNASVGSSRCSLIEGVNTFEKWDDKIIWNLKIDSKVNSLIGFKAKALFNVFFDIF